MNYNLLHYFKVLGETEHFGQAAKLLHIEQPSLSQSIKKLESDLNVPLFEKHGRNIALTEAGRVYHQKISKALEAIDAATLELRASKQIETVVISSVHSHPKSAFSGHVTQFLNEPGNEHIKISIQERHTPESFEALRKQQCHLIVCSNKSAEDDFSYIPISRQSVILLVPERHPLAVFDQLDIRNVLPFKFIYPAPITGMWTLFERLFAEVGERPPMAMEAESVAFTASLVGNEFGIALSPDVEHLNVQNVKKIKIVNKASSFYHYLAYSNSKTLPPAAERFKQFMIRQAALPDEGARENDAVP